jgi:hypothetical protein
MIWQWHHTVVGGSKIIQWCKFLETRRPMVIGGLNWWLVNKPLFPNYEIQILKPPSPSSKTNRKYESSHLPSCLWHL